MRKQTVKKTTRKQATKKTVEKNLGGRPNAEIDYDNLQSLVEIQCTGEECASVLKVDYDTLDSNLKRKYGYGFSEYFKKHSGAGKASLRRRQFRMSETNPAMAIWLGKQYLGQKDTVEQKTYFEDQTIKIVDDKDKTKLSKYLAK